jgi:hypothetical protein|tara:strand:- start:204 stop:626 length:423 start_codon:yes stop_codon:yes gene_type:complete
MTFKDGLLVARVQIAWILALLVSTTLIITLEALDTEERISARLSAVGVTAVDDPARLEFVATVLDEARTAFVADPGRADVRAAYLVAVAAAVPAGILDRATATDAARSALAAGPVNTLAMRAAVAQAAITLPEINVPSGL